MHPVSFRSLTLADAPSVLALMRRAEGGLGRLPGEMDLSWMEEALAGALAGGLAIGAWDGAKLAGLIKASRMPSVQFQHVLWDLTVAVAPESQGREIGHGLFARLLADAAALEPRIERVELVVREGLTHAVRLYERLGFRREAGSSGGFTCPTARTRPTSRWLCSWSRGVETNRTSPSVRPELVEGLVLKRRTVVPRRPNRRIAPSSVSVVYTCISERCISMDMPETKTFKSGNSEAVRLPQGIGFGVGVAVNVERDGDRVVITPTRNPAEEKARLLALLADLDAIGGSPDGVQERDPFEFPERRGL